MHTLYVGIDMYSVISRIEQYFPTHICLFDRNPNQSLGEFRYHSQRQTQQYGLIKKNIFSLVFSDTTIFPGTYGNSWRISSLTSGLQKICERCHHGRAARGPTPTCSDFVKAWWPLRYDPQKFKTFAHFQTPKQVRNRHRFFSTRSCRKVHDNACFLTAWTKYVTENSTLSASFQTWVRILLLSSFQNNPPRSQALWNIA